MHSFFLNTKSKKKKHGTQNHPKKHLRAGYKLDSYIVQKQQQQQQKLVMQNLAMS